jgi:hypothetical protein
MLALIRLDAQGRRDTSFGSDGMVVLPIDGDRGVSSVVAVRDSRWPSPMLLCLNGGDGSLSRPIREERAIEFYHAGFGHYVIAATQREIATLDGPLYDPSRAWRRTGRSFRVWSGNAPHLSAVCRFFSSQSFAPKSSHFYTPYVEECTSLRAGSTWTFEGEPFRLQLPTATPAGHCPNGSVPLYRAYNNGLGGTPNHRYTDDPAILASMLNQGWIFEGDVQTKCSPASRAVALRQAVCLACSWPCAPATASTAVYRRAESAATSPTCLRTGDVRLFCCEAQIVQ